MQFQEIPAMPYQLYRNVSISQEGLPRSLLVTISLSDSSYLLSWDLLIRTLDLVFHLLLLAATRFRQEYFFSSRSFCPTRGLPVDFFHPKRRSIDRLQQLGQCCTWSRFQPSHPVTRRRFWTTPYCWRAVNCSRCVAEGHPCPIHSSFDATSKTTFRLQVVTFESL